MNRTFIKTLVLCFAIILSCSIKATNLYWIGGTGNWNDPSHWSTTSGGTAGAVIPTAADNVFFNANSFTATSQSVTIAGTAASCLSMNWTGATFVPSFQIQNPLNIYGSLTLVTNMTFVMTNSDLSFLSTNVGNTITSAGKILSSPSGYLRFNGLGGEWTLQDNLNATQGNGINLIAGTLFSNSNSIATATFYSGGSAVRALSISNSTLTTNTGGNWAVQGTNFTLDATASTINCNGNFFGGGTDDYNNINYSNTSGTFIGGLNHNKVTFLSSVANLSSTNSVYSKVIFLSNAGINGNGTFDTISFTPGYKYEFQASQTQTINEFDINGTCGQPITIQSASPGTRAKIISGSSSVNLNYLRLYYMDFLAGTTFIANNSIDGGTNLGITINAPVGKNLYWIGGNGNWNDPAHWSLTANGVTANCIPNKYDNVFFTTGSFTGLSKTMTMNVDGECKNMDWTGAPSTPVFAGTASLQIEGSLKFISAMNRTYTGIVYFTAPQPGLNITMAGKTFASDVYFYQYTGSNGGWILQDAFSTTTGMIHFEGGTLNTNGKTVSCARMMSTPNTPRTLNLGSSVINITDASSNSWDLSNTDLANLTINAGTSHIKLQSSGAASGYFNSSGKSFYDVSFLDAAGGSLINGSGIPGGTFHNVSFTGSASLNAPNATYNKMLLNGGASSINYKSTIDSLLIGSGTTNYFASSTPTLNIGSYLMMNGTPGNLTKFYPQSGNPYNHYINKSSSCNVCVNYVDLVRSNTTGAPFYASNSVDGGNNTGWNFAACPSNTLTVGPIVGKATPCNNSTGNVYSIPAISGATYFWSVPAGSAITQGQGSTSIVVTAGTVSGNVSVTVTACGTSSIVTKAITPQALPVINSINVTNATCSNNDGSLSASVSSGNAPYHYQWSSGDTLASAVNLLSGQYLLQVTDNNGCRVTATGNVNASNGPSITVVSTTPASCNGGANGGVTVSVSGGTTPYTAHWSNGATALSITGLAAGPYDLTIKDSINCAVVKTINITQPTAITNSFTSNPSACAGSTGDATAFPSGGAGGYTYLWGSNAANQTTSTASNLSSGVYTVTIKDANNCIITDVALVNNVASTLSSTIGNIVAGDCSLNSPGSLTMNATGGVGTYTYQWSNGSTNATVSGLFPGTYFCVVTDASLCSSVQSATVPSNIGTILQSLCMVTVDTTSANPSNLIIWEKTTTHDIKSFKIYRETSSQNVYQAIATIPYNALSEYNDAVANPAVHSWRYKITAIDSCDNETAYSLTHKTIHLTQNLGVGATINLAWDYYDGFTYSTYYIWRHDPSTNWVLLDSLSTNYTAYTDFTPPSVNSRYMIEVRPPSACNSSAFKTAGINNVQAQVVKSKSNIRNNFTTNVITGLSDSKYMKGYVRVYPNPASNLLHVDLLLKNGNASIYIVNILGQVVYSSSTTEPTNTIDVSPLTRGVYTVKVVTEKGQAVQKIVVE